MSWFVVHALQNTFLYWIISYYSKDEQEEIAHEVEKAIKKIRGWKAYLMRTTHQEPATSTVLEKLSSSQVFIIMDWAMKFLPVCFGEWFGKKGKSWHVSAVITKSAEEELEVWIPIKHNDVISDHGIGKDKKRVEATESEARVWQAKLPFSEVFDVQQFNITLKQKLTNLN